MKILLILIFVLSVSVHLSSSFFFGPIRSSCRSDRDCPRLQSSGGRCIDRANKFCGLANIFRSNKENCGYKECARCVNDWDCKGDRYCSNFYCLTREDRYRDGYRDGFRDRYSNGISLSLTTSSRHQALKTVLNSE